MKSVMADGTMCVVFTDIEGSTGLLRVLGDRFDEVLARHRELVRGAVLGHGGVELHAEGDGFLVLFAQPEDAVAACVDAQIQLSAEDWPEAGVVRVRMGLHVGDAHAAIEDYSGLGIHQGARVVRAAHGGQVVASADFVAAMAGGPPPGVGLSDLGAFHLRDFDDPVHLFQILHPQLAASFPPPPVPSAAVRNLPSARTSFVGRHAEVNELVKVTDVASLVTIVGAGGVGKSRLAGETGLLVAGRYPAGVWLVALADIDDPHRVASRVKDAMGLPDRPGSQPLDVIIDHLRGRPAMVILDNCEHLLDGCADVADSLLSASGTTRILATSRESLGLPGEVVVRLGPLGVPPAEAEADVAGWPAVELFAARAAQARNGFVVTPTNASVVASVCCRLDGIPLALELAAARLASMSLEQVDHGLEHGLSVLDTRRGGAPRQRTLRATIEWSRRLLSAEDDAVFRRLAVFRGGFTIDAVETVVGGHDPGAVLARLVAQSLVELDHDGERGRYRLLETIRAYAAEQLAGAGERPAVADRHASFYTALAAGCSPAAATGEVFDRMEEEQENFLVALDHLTSAEDARHRALIVHLATFWNVRGHWRVARREVQRCLERTDLDLAGRGELTRLMGFFAQNLADHPAADTHIDAALAIARELDDRELECDCLCTLGGVALSLGDCAAAESHYEAALAIARALADRSRECTCVADLGIVAVRVADFAVARARYESALEMSRELGRRRTEGTLVGNLGSLALETGDHEEARRRNEDALAIARELGDPVIEGGCLGRLGNGANAVGDYLEARRLYEEAIAIARRLGDRRIEASWRGNLGVVASSLGDHAEARRHYQESLGIALEIGDRQLQCSAGGNLGEVAHLLGDHAEARARLNDAVARARELGELRYEAYFVYYLGIVSAEMGDFADSTQHLERAIAIALQMGRENSDLLDACADLLSLAGLSDEAVVLHAAADRVNIRVDNARDVPGQERYDATVARCRRALSVQAFDTATSRGATLDWTSAADVALESLRRVCG